MKYARKNEPRRSKHGTQCCRLTRMAKMSRRWEVVVVQNRRVKSKGMVGNEIKKPKRSLQRLLCASVVPVLLCGVAVCQY